LTPDCKNRRYHSPITPHEHAHGKLLPPLTGRGQRFSRDLRLRDIRA
jgi:hypothetical protein